jgi:hypothetical protein
MISFENLYSGLFLADEVELGASVLLEVPPRPDRTAKPRGEDPGITLLPRPDR